MKLSCTIMASLSKMINAIFNLIEKNNVSGRK